MLQSICLNEIWDDCIAIVLSVVNFNRYIIHANNKHSAWHFYLSYNVKVRLLPFKKNCVISLTESPLKMMKNAFYFIVKAYFIQKIFKILSQLLGYVGKMAWLER